MSLPPPTERQARLIWLAVSGLAMAALVGLIAGLVWGLGRALGRPVSVLWPLAVGGVLAYLLDPLVDRIPEPGHGSAEGHRPGFWFGTLIPGRLWWAASCLRSLAKAGSWPLAFPRT